MDDEKTSIKLQVDSLKKKRIDLLSNAKQVLDELTKIQPSMHVIKLISDPPHFFIKTPAKVYNLIYGDDNLTRLLKILKFRYKHYHLDLHTLNNYDIATLKYHESVEDCIADMESDMPEVCRYKQ